jgi:hypothetical protein
MSGVGNALKRKFGPLPAWAWAVIAGGALYLYRHNAALGASSSSNVPAAVAPDLSDQTAGPQSPVTLAPGESVYDPATGQLLTPGDTGAGGGDDGTAAPPPPSPTTGAGKRKPKPKPKHKKAAKPATHGKAKSRPNAVLRGRRATRGKSTPKIHATPRHVTTAATAHTPARGRARAAVPPVALRQRPAAPRVVNHAEQRVQAHPAKPPPAARRAPAPAPHAPAPQRRVAARNRV